MNQLATDGISPVPSHDESSYFTQVFAWMAAGVVVSGAVSAAVYSSGEALHVFEGSSGPTIFAYDVQRLKKYEPPPGADYVVVEKDAIVGALALYLDFVNLFLYLLRLLGRRR